VEILLYKAFGQLRFIHHYLNRKVMLNCVINLITNAGLNKLIVKYPFNSEHVDLYYRPNYNTIA